MGRRRGRWIAAIAAVALLTGCGADGTDGDGDDATTADDASAAAEDGAEDDGAEDDGAQGSSEAAGGGLDCDDAFIAFAELDQAYRYAVRQGTPDEPVDYEAAAAQVEAAVDTAPPGIEDAYQRYGSAVLPFFAGLVAMDFDASDPGSGDVKDYVALTETLDSSAVDQARADIQAWLTGPCEDA